MSLFKIRRFEMEEIWKGVIYQGVDYSWRLEVSNLGKLRNTKNY